MIREDILKMIQEKSSEFNLDDFFFNESDDDYCAIKIISPSQDICFSVEYHDEGAEAIMKALYSDFDLSFSGNAYWPDVVNNWGCVAIQIVKRNFIIVNMPSKLTQYQFDRLFSFYRDMIRINGVLRKSGEEIDIQTNVSKNGRFLNLGKALMDYKTKIVSNDKVKKSIKI